MVAHLCEETVMGRGINEKVKKAIWRGGAVAALRGALVPYTVLSKQRKIKANKAATMQRAKKRNGFLLLWHTTTFNLKHQY